MKKPELIIFFICALLGAVAWGQDDDYAASDLDSVVWLKGTKCTTMIVGGDSLIKYRLSYAKGHAPQYYYDINRKEKRILITLVHSRCSTSVIHDSIKDAAVGPIRSVHFREDLQNINQDMKVMLPVLYYVTLITVDCDPIVKEQGIAIHDNGRDVFIDFKWPSSKQKRRKLYDIPNTGFKLFIASVATVTVGALAVGGYYLYKNSKKKKNDPLNPVLPEHPSSE
jgi:hypothetical protein